MAVADAEPVPGVRRARRGGVAAGDACGAADRDVEQRAVAVPAVRRIGGAMELSGEDKCQHGNGKATCGKCHWIEPRKNGRGNQCWHDPPVVFPSGFTDRRPVGANDRACAYFKAVPEPTREQMLREAADSAAAMIADGRITVKASVNCDAPKHKKAMK